MKIGGSKGVHYNFTQNYIPSVFLYFMKYKDCAGIFISGKYSVYVVFSLYVGLTRQYFLTSKTPRD
jgi:hypothetical protein